MKMFGLKKNAKEFEAVQTAPPEPERKKPEEYYRVGITDHGHTTLTLLTNSSAMTLTMDSKSCERLIAILRATYSDENET